MIIRNFKKSVKFLKQKRFLSNNDKVFVVAAKRTCVGSFLGKISTVNAIDLGSFAIKSALESCGSQKGKVMEIIGEVILGNVVSAGLGQAPTRQVLLKAGLSPNVEAITINKVCASGMKSIVYASQSLQLGIYDAVIAGGTESMSNAPYYVQRRLRLGSKTLIDGVIHDGLYDTPHSVHMGEIAERFASAKHITRLEQDEFTISSYRKSEAAWNEGCFEKEIAPIIVGKNNLNLITRDEEIANFSPDKMPNLKPAFPLKESGYGTITVANSSKISDGASALILMSQKGIEHTNVAPMAEILGYADAALDPMDFPIAPSVAIPKALKHANIKQDDVSRWEINEAFAAVVIGNQRILGLNKDLININGGAVATGHPIGSSGSRIVVSLIHALEKNEIGCAAICNGGGGATAIVLKKL